eukprot:g769.t1
MWNATLMARRRPKPDGDSKRPRPRPLPSSNEVNAPRRPLPAESRPKVTSSPTKEMSALERVMAARRGKAPPIPSYLNDDSDSSTDSSDDEGAVPMSRMEQEKQTRRRERARLQLEKEMTREQREKKMREMFAVADTDNSGTLDKDELRVCLTNSGFGFSKAEIEFMVVESDADGDGGVDFIEFAPLCYEMMIENLAKSLPDEEVERAEQERYKREQEEAWKKCPGMPLPAGTRVGHWEVIDDGNGNLYYYHRRSQQSMWDAPSEVLEHAAKLFRKEQKVDRRTIFGAAGELRKKKAAIAAAIAAGKKAEADLKERLAPSVAAQLAAFAAKKWALRAAVKSSKAQLVLNELTKVKRKKERELKKKEEEEAEAKRLAAITPREVREERERIRKEKERQEQLIRDREMTELEAELLKLFHDRGYSLENASPEMGLGCGTGGKEPDVLPILMKQIVRRAENKKYFERFDTVLEFEAVKNCIQRALWASAEKGWVPTAKICVELAKDPRDLLNLGKKNDTGETPLALACRHFRIQVVKVLMSGEITVSKPCFSRGRSALHWACDIEASRLPRNPKTKHESEEELAKRKKVRADGVLALVNILIDNGAMLEPLDEGCRTPLHLAAQREDSRIVKALLEAKTTRKGGSKKYRSQAQAMRGETPLHEAAKYGRLENMKLLLDAGADANSPTFGREDTPAHWAAGAGQTDALKILFSADVSVDTTDRCGRTPLHIASANGHCETISYLLSMGADIDRRDGGGLSSLHHSVKNSHLKAMTLLLQEGADQHAETRSGMNVLHLAIKTGDLSLVEILLGRGVNSESVDIKGRTPIDLAKHRGEVHITGFFATPLAKNLAARNALERFD